MRKAVVFSGQGSHRKGMCMHLLNTPRTTELWERMKDAMMRNFGVPLQEVIQENPTKLQIFAEAVDLDTMTKQSCKEVRNTPESAPRSHEISNPNGVMQLTYLTQPCVLAAQMVAVEKMKEAANWSTSSYTALAGHSLGEFSALCTLGAFSPETALNLTFKRGLLMEKAFETHSRKRHTMYACNPLRAKLHSDPSTAADYFFIFVELISRALSNTTSFVELANYNLLYEQYVVAGDVVALSVLGKCLDPQFRANCPHRDTLDGIVRDALASVKLDKAEGVTMEPNLPDPPDFVTSAFKRYGKRRVFRRSARGPDDGATPALEKLTHLTLEEDGRSGLKKKSWYLPLSIEIPFHTSRLRECSDKFLPIVRSALPDEATLRTLLSVRSPTSATSYNPKHPLWVTNLTGSTFAPFDEQFQDAARDAITSLNVGEVQHSGRYSSELLLSTLNDGIKEQSVREICACVLAAQLSHSVLWIEDMDAIVHNHKCTTVHEFAPVRNVSELFKRSHFQDEANDAVFSIEAKSFPADGAL